MTAKQQIAFEQLVTELCFKNPGKPRLWAIYRLIDKGITPETF
jgi:hypothetical protein